MVMLDQLLETMVDSSRSRVTLDDSSMRLGQTSFLVLVQKVQSVFNLLGNHTQRIRVFKLKNS